MVSWKQLTMFLTTVLEQFVEILQSVICIDPPGIVYSRVPLTDGISHGEFGTMERLYSIHAGTSTFLVS